ncbi:MAG: hypothetical protein Q7J14_01335, partial [Candidatus Magasanikbacteria bacterium]|nr:hypothetical protein [Candidatus Magasanikbacteria bacterium]
MKKIFLLLFVGYWLFVPILTNAACCICKTTLVSGIEQTVIEVEWPEITTDEECSDESSIWSKTICLIQPSSICTVDIKTQIIPITEILDDIKLQAPTLTVRIPGFDKFSEPPTVMDASGKAYFPWMGEYIRAIYNFGLTAISI